MPGNANEAGSDTSWFYYDTGLLPVQNRNISANSRRESARVTEHNPRASRKYGPFSLRRAA